MNAFRKTLALILAVVMVLSMAAAAFAAEEITFSDVEEGAWYYDSVTRWVKAGVVHGKTATTFEPDSPMKRGEFAKVMAEVLGLSGDVEFPFADGKHWSNTYVARCYASGIVNGYSVDGQQYFFPEDEITREQAFAMMVRAMNINAGTEEVLGQFEDADDVSNWAKKENSTATLITYGAVVGDQGKINPKESITRAEVLKILDRLVGIHVAKDGTVTTATKDTDNGIAAGAKTCGIVVVHPECEADVQVSVETVAVENGDGEIETVNQIQVVVTDKEGNETEADLIPTNSSTTTDDKGNEIEEQPIILVTTNIPAKEEEGEETPKQENITLVPEQKVEISGATEEKEQIEIEIVPACQHEDCEFTSNYNGTHTGTCECGKELTNACAYLEGGNTCYYCGFDRTAAARIEGTYYADLASALEAAKEGETVTLMADITTDKAFEVSAITLDGNGHTIAKTENDEENNPVIVTTGATIQNLTVNGEGRCVFVNHDLSSNLVIDNCVLDGTYALNVWHGTPTEYTLTVTDSKLLGWTSYGQIGSATFENCVFGEGSTGYAHLRIYAETELTGCTFGEGFTIDRANEDLDAFGLTLTDCVCGEEKVTAGNFAELLAGELGGTYSLPGMVTVTVNGEEVEFYAARVGEDRYLDLQSAVDAAEAGETVTVLKDLELNASVLIREGKELTLDLNGKTITGTDTTSANFGLLDVEGATLTLADSSEEQTGAITLTATVESGWDRLSAVVLNHLGTLNVTGGTLEHLGGTSMAYGIDNETNSDIAEATTNISGGTVKSVYRAVRQFANGAKLRNTLNITGGNVGLVWVQSPSELANLATTNITGGTVAGVKITGANADLTLNVAASALAEGCEISGTMPAGTALVLKDGVYTLEKEKPADLPVANVVNSTEYENVELPWGSYGQWSPTEGLDSCLEAAYTFSCVDTPDEAAASDYADWHCDFYVKLDKDLGANQIFLGGNYGSFGWIGFHNGDLTLDAETEIPLLGSVAGAPWTYADVAANVGTFICGVGDVDNALSGATFTVMLRLTNPENAEEFYDVATINYTFE